MQVRERERSVPLSDIMYLSAGLTMHHWPKPPDIESPLRMSMPQWDVGHTTQHNLPPYYEGTVYASARAGAQCAA